MDSGPYCLTHGSKEACTCLSDRARRLEEHKIALEKLSISMTFQLNNPVAERDWNTIAEVRNVIDKILGELDGRKD